MVSGCFIVDVNSDLGCEQYGRRFGDTAAIFRTFVSRVGARTPIISMNELYEYYTGFRPLSRLYLISTTFREMAQLQFLETADCFLKADGGEESENQMFAHIVAG